MVMVSSESLQEEKGARVDGGEGCGAGDGACDMIKQIHCGHCEYKCNMTKTKLGVIVYIPKLTQLGPAADVEHPL